MHNDIDNNIVNNNVGDKDNPNNNNEDRNNIRSDSGRIASEHSSAVRAFAVLVAGTAIGLIFNAVCGYEYSDALIARASESFFPPFEGVAGFFDVLRCVSKAAKIDVLLFMLIALFGVSYICRQGCTLLIMARGVGLGVSVGVLATLAAGGMLKTKHGGACAVTYLLFSSLLSVVLVFFSSFAERASSVFHSLAERETGVIFTAKFGAYLVVCIAAEGAVLITRAVYMLAIHILTL